MQGVLKVKVKGHVIRALSWILGMSYSVIDSLVSFLPPPGGIAICHVCYVAAKATYIRLLHGKIGFLGGFSALAP